MLRQQEPLMICLVLLTVGLAPVLGAQPAHAEAGTVVYESTVSNSEQVEKRVMVVFPDLSESKKRSAIQSSVGRVDPQAAMKTMERHGYRYEVDSRSMTLATSKSGGNSRGTAKPPDYDRITEEECMSKAASYKADGWFKNHYGWCQISTVKLEKWFVGREGRKLLAGLYFVSMLRAEGNRERRQLVVWQTNYSTAATRDWAAGVQWGSDLLCDGSPGFNQCKVSGTGFRRVRDGSVTRTKYVLSSAASGSRGKDKIAFGAFRPWQQVYELGLVATAAGPRNVMRCDSAAYQLPYKAGCTFSQVTGVLYYSRSDNDVSAVARHIFDAQVRPQVTYPRFNGKQVPRKLHRMYYDKRAIARNTNAARATCKKVWGKDYAKGDKFDCDEYPFKTTREGAAKGDRKYSARVLNRTPNRVAGNRYGVWLTNDHILDGDAFYVTIK